MKKTVKLLLSIFTMLSLCICPSNKIKANDDSNSHVTINELCETHFFINNENQIIETAMCEVGNTIISSYRVINEDGSYTMTISDEKETYEINGITDYSTFYQIALNFMNSNNPYSRGCNMVGSNFKHVLVGFQPTVTLYASGYAGDATLAEIASDITLVLGAVPASVILKVAKYALTFLSNSETFKVVINTSTWEIRFSYDNVYYTHCYHQVLLGYNSQGTLIDRKEYYNQVIGG